MDPSPAPVAATAAPTSTTPANNSNTLAAVAYVLTWITGLIIYFTAPKEDKYARWHAVQAIGLGVGVILVFIVLNILSMIIPFIGFLSTLVWLATIVLVVILAVKAYQGQTVRLPIVAELADKHA